MVPAASAPTPSGLLMTEMTDKLPDEVKEGWYKQIPLRRGGTPSDVAKVALFLASDLRRQRTSHPLLRRDELLGISRHRKQQQRFGALRHRTGIKSVRQVCLSGRFV